MTPAPLHGLESADELLFLGAALAHVVAYRERERIARIERNNREALRRATGTRYGRAVSFA